MQRLGFLKPLVALASSRESWDFESLGRELIRTVSQRTKATISSGTQTYIRRRLTDRTYNDLKKRLAAKNSPTETVLLEVQDTYLASSALPSQTGKLVEGDWRKYPLLATQLGLVRRGTFSALVRGMAFLELCSAPETRAFERLQPECNPFVMQPPQTLLLLYSFIENDGDVVKPLYGHLQHLGDVFSDRDAGDHLPEIYRGIERAESKRNLPIEEREELEKLLRMAQSIADWRCRKYTGSGAITEAVTVRLEPYVDMGLLDKPDPFRYEYGLTEQGRAFAEGLAQVDDLDCFLVSGFFGAIARFFHSRPQHRRHVPRLVRALYRTCQDLKSGLGYVPIKELALLAVARSLPGSGFYFEIKDAFEALRKFQKEHPDCLRFTVNRMGELAHVKFLKEPSTSSDVTNTDE